MKYRVVFVDANDRPIDRTTSPEFSNRHLAIDWGIAQIYSGIANPPLSNDVEGFWIEKVSDAKPASKVP